MQKVFLPCTVNAANSVAVLTLHFSLPLTMFDFNWRYNKYLNGMSKQHQQFATQYTVIHSTRDELFPAKLKDNSNQPEMPTRRDQ